MLSCSAEPREIDRCPKCNRDLWPMSSAHGRNMSVIIEYLTDVPVHQAARPRQDYVRQYGEQAPKRRQVRGHHAFLLRACWISKVSEPPAGGAEPVFKRGQAIVIQIGAAKIDFVYARRLAFLNEPPKQKG